MRTWIREREKSLEAAKKNKDVITCYLSTGAVCTGKVVVLDAGLVELSMPPEKYAGQATTFWLQKVNIIGIKR